MKHSVVPHIMQLDKKFLLTDRKRERLYYDGSHLVEVEFIENGNLAVFKVDMQGKVRRISMGEMSLPELSARYLESEEPNEIKKYMVNPYQEAERIFNAIRFKYLSAILKGRREPQEYISSEFNSLFKSLAGFSLRNDPGGIRARKLAFAEGFSMDEIPMIDLRNEKCELKIILKYLFDVFSRDLPGLYRELIAIKPGFHEIWADDNWLDEGEGHIEGLRDSPYHDRRTLVLKEIHGLIDPAPHLDLRNVIYEISIPAFMTYAPCNVTEGPFMYKKRNDVSCYQLLRDREKVNLSDHFLIYDYWGKDIREKDLEIIQCFQYHRCLD
jgi:hypothetical protein